MNITFGILTERDILNFMLSWFRQVIEGVMINYVIRAKNKMFSYEEDYKDVF